jgi:hypothetical protein
VPRQAFNFYTGLIGGNKQMNLFIGFMLFCFVGGLLACKIPSRHRSLILLGVCLFMTIAYYSLSQL